MSGNKPWTGREIRKLMELYPTKSNEEVARVIGRGVYAITSKASRLGLEKSELYVRDCKGWSSQPCSRADAHKRERKREQTNTTEPGEYSDLDRLLSEIRKSNNNINYKVQF